MLECDDDMANERSIMNGKLPECYSEYREDS